VTHLFHFIEWETLGLVYSDGLLVLLLSRRTRWFNRIDGTNIHLKSNTQVPGRR